MGVTRQTTLPIGFTINYWEPQSITVDLVGGQIIAVFVPFKDRATYDANGHTAGIKSESRRVTFPLYQRDASKVQTLRDWACRQAVDRLDALYGVGVADSGAPVTAQVDSTPPHEVDNLILTPGSKQISATWDNPTDSDFSHVLIDGRKADSGDGSPGVWVAFDGAIDASGTVIPVPTSGETYDIRIRTVDGDGNTSTGVIENATPSA